MAVCISVLSSPLRIKTNKKYIAIKKILPVKYGNGTFSVEYIEENVKNAEIIMKRILNIMVLQKKNVKNVVRN